jgi:hypothetical protein
MLVTKPPTALTIRQTNVDLVGMDNWATPPDAKSAALPFLIHIESRASI